MSSIPSGERVIGKTVEACNDEEPLSRMGVAEVMGRDQAVATASNVDSTTDVVIEFSQAVLDDPPGLPVVVALEIANVLQDHIWRAESFENIYDFVEKRSSCSISSAVLIPGF
jgi:hypothetical protein